MTPTPDRILLIRPSAMGDVARTVPVLVALRLAFPRATIDWLVQDSFVDIVASHPALTRALPFPRREFSRWFARSQWMTLAAYLRSFARERYDLVIDAQGLARSAVIAWCTRAPIRVGHADARELGWLAYTRRVPGSIDDHAVDRMLSLVRSLGVPADSSPESLRLYTPPHARGFAHSHPALAGRRYVVLAPTSRWPAKQWPDDRFASLALRLSGQGTPVAIVGATSERAQVHRCLELGARGNDVLDLVGSTSVAQLMDLIEHAALVVGNDSAALHIAVGFGRPIVGLYGPTRVQRVGPCGRSADTIQHVVPGEALDHKDPASRVIIERISLEEVHDACLARLA